MSEKLLVQALMLLVAGILLLVAGVEFLYSRKASGLMLTTLSILLMAVTRLLN